MSAKMNLVEKQNILHETMNKIGLEQKKLRFIMTIMYACGTKTWMGA